MGDFAGKGELIYRNGRRYTGTKMEKKMERKNDL